jgi:hypothetical protein
MALYKRSDITRRRLELMRDNTIKHYLDVSHAVEELEPVNKPNPFQKQRLLFLKKLRLSLDNTINLINENESLFAVSGGGMVQH